MIKPLLYTLGLILLFGLQGFIGLIVKWINEKIKQTMTEIEHDPETGECKSKLINKERLSFELVDVKKGKLGFLTKVIGYFEILIFSTLTIILFFQPLMGIVEKFKFIGLSISGWLALKIFGNYQQWSGPVFGRATFYSFLIGSFLNIGGAILLGIIFVYALR